MEAVARFTDSGSIYIPRRFTKALNINQAFDEIIVTLEDDRIILTKGRNNLDENEEKKQ